jgi:3alpha(or 20beta)-hydroxysteroid dehydrogenase
MKTQGQKVVLVTGAARGHGLAEARLFSRNGYQVVMADINPDIAGTSRDVKGALGVILDVASDDSWAEAMAAVEREFGRLDVLVNNAGVLSRNSIGAETAENFMSVVQVNQLGVFLGMKYAVGLLKRQGGAIVNISSTSGMTALPSTVAYNATKWAVRGMTKVAALEFAEFGIRVNSVHPGPIVGEMLPGDAEFLDRRARALLVRRLGTPDDVATMVYFVANDAQFSTGVEFICDGGALTGKYETT